MLVISLSEKEFKWLRKKNEKEHEKWAAIRIYSQPEEVSRLSNKFNAQFEDILITHFTDIKEAHEEDGKWYKPFSVQNYNEIIDFVNKHQDCDKIYVHCQLGICRSAGVVVGLANIYDWIQSQHGSDGNADVYPYPNVVSMFV